MPTLIKYLNGRGSKLGEMLHAYPKRSLF